VSSGSVVTRMTAPPAAATPILDSPDGVGSNAESVPDAAEPRPGRRPDTLPADYPVVADGPAMTGDLGRSTGMNLNKFTAAGLIALHVGEALRHEIEEHLPEDTGIEAPAPSGVAGAVIEPGKNLEIRTGPPSASLLDPDQGILLAAGPEAVASGAAGHFRIKSMTGRTIYQGSITSLDGGGDLLMDNNVVVAGGTVAVPPELARYVDWAYLIDRGT
jgi:hypothetical protein